MFFGFIQFKVNLNPFLLPFFFQTSLALSPQIPHLRYFMTLKIFQNNIILLLKISQTKPFTIALKNIAKNTKDPRNAATNHKLFNL